MNHDIYYILLVFCISLLTASVFYKPILFYARTHGVYDNPDERKLQRTPVPVMGGFVVFVGSIAGLLSYWFVRDITPLVPGMVAMLLMLLVGSYDDTHNMSPKQKFIIEIGTVIALALVNQYGINDFHGLWGVHEISPWIAWPLTVVACVGIINAINMIDGIDGLSSGLSIVSLAFISWAMFKAHDFVRAAMGVTLIGGLIPFFVMNVFGKKSKMFIGDAGTMMIGIAICDLLLAMLTHNSYASKRFDVTDFNLMAFSLAVLSIPVFDTIRVMVGRMWRGHSPFRPDRAHLHHAFIGYGFQHLEASLLEILLNVLIIFIWMMVFLSHLPVEWQFYVVIIVGFATTCIMFWLLKRYTERKNKQ